MQIGNEEEQTKMINYVTNFNYKKILNSNRKWRKTVKSPSEKPSDCGENFLKPTANCRVAHVTYKQVLNLQEIKIRKCVMLQTVQMKKLAQTSDWQSAKTTLPQPFWNENKPALQQANLQRKELSK